MSAGTSGTTGQRDAAARLATTTRSVYQAARLVRNNLQKPAALSIAIAELEEAAETHDTGTTGLVDLGFANLDQAQPAVVPAAQFATATVDLLLTAMADLDVADVLLAAGAATGDGVTGPAAEPAVLDSALTRIDVTSRSLAGEGDESTQLGFGEPMAPIHETGSPDLAAAAERLQGRVDEVLDALKHGTEGVARRAVTALKDVVPAFVKTAIAELGETIPALPRVGRLIAKGLRLLERALVTLGRLLHVEFIGQVRDQVAELWSRLKDGTILEPALQKWFGEADTRTETKLTLDAATELNALDEASATLSGLVAGFNSAASTLELTIGRISAVTATLLLVSHFLPAIAPWVAPTAITGYVLVLGTVVVIGMDYADSGLDRGQVAGVRQVLQAARV